MKKKRYYVIVILLLSFIFIGEVKAANSNGQIIFNNPYLSSAYGTFGSLIQQDNSRHFDFTPNTQHSNVKVNFDELTIPKNTDYFIIPFSILNKSNDKYYSCSTEYSSSNEITQFNYTTTYADGTESTNEGSANTTSSYRYCSQFRTDNDNITIYVTFTYTDGVGVNCNVLGNDKEMLAMCPITSGRSNGNYKIKNFLINISTNETSNFNTYSIRIPNNTFMVKYDSNAQMIEQQQETNTKLDEIQNSDISSDSKESPNSDDYDDYQDAENSLFDKMEEADTSNLNVAIDGNSANFVWDTITRFYNSNALLMNFLISILSIGIIKMALGR